MKVTRFTKAAFRNSPICVVRVGHRTHRLRFKQKAWVGDAVFDPGLRCIRQCQVPLSSRKRSGSAASPSNLHHQYSGWSLLTSLGRNFCSGPPFKCYRRGGFSVRARMEATMHSVIYVIGLIVVVLLILSFLGLR